MAEKGGSADEQKPVSDMSSLADALPGGKASGHSGLVNDLKDELQTPVDPLDSLHPKIKKRVEALQKIQDEYDELQPKLQAEHDALQSMFLKDKAALEAKYQKMYEPLYSKRHDIVNGITDVEDNKEEKTAEASKEDNIEEKGVAEYWRKGVFEFWLTAMTKNEILRAEITDRDGGALAFLKDIKWSRLDDEKGFKLDFFFNENPYFKNTVLTKKFCRVDENLHTFESVGGTVIDWLPGKKGAKSGKTVTGDEQCASFFDFFTPRHIPDDDVDDDYHSVDLRDLLTQDYEIGLTIKDEIIPRAVYWYTREFVETVDEDDEEVDEKDEEVDENKVLL